MNFKEYQQFILKHPDLEGFIMGPIRMRDGTVYWKRKPTHAIDRNLMPKAQKEAALLFGETAYKNYGKTGFVKGMPVIAAVTTEALQGKKFKIPKWERVANELRESLRKIAVIVTT